MADRWDDLEQWWDVYADAGHATAVELADLLEQSSERWRQSAGPFDTDPLAADLTRERFLRGPSQPSREEGWSQWLAQLLGPSPELVTRLFEVNADGAPNEVLREDKLAKETGSRFADVLVRDDDYGVSIEVKLGDENYRKTAETAALVERHDDGDREWTHFLLLPASKTERLESVLEVPAESCADGRRRIAWDEPGSVTVMHWRDVTGTLRRLLRRGEVVDDHWAANAYLFCTLVEQRMLGFEPQPTIDRLAHPTDVVDAIRPVTVARTLEKQLTYVRERVES